MNKKILIFFLFVLMMFVPMQTAQAQAQDAPHVFDSTMPIDAELRAALDAWLLVDNPSSAIYYAVTFAQPSGFDTLVSLAGFDDITNGWNITGDVFGVNHVLWLGSVRVMVDGTVERLTTDAQQARGNGYEVAAIGDFIPNLAPLYAHGGGDWVRLPMSSSKSFQFGILGVHAAGYAGSGVTGDMVAVDFVTGTDMGANFATGYVFASEPGVVEYVCEDEDSTAVVVKSANDNRFLYAHLNHNDALVLEHSFAPSGEIGYLKFGSFGTPDEGCGWADQRDAQHHLHWGIEPANGVFRAESCVLTIAKNNWKCGSEEIGPGEYITARGVNDETDPYSSPTMFDFILIGLLNIYDTAIVQQLPEGESSFALTAPILNSVRVVLRVVNVLIIGNLNLTPTIGLWILAIYWKIAFGAIWLIAAILRTIKMIPTL